MSTFEAFRNYLPSVFIARLAPGMTSALAVQRVEAIAKRFSVERISSAPPSETVRPLQQALVGDRKTALTILMGSAALLLLIACANVTNLLLSRAATRQREIAVRVVLGATRLRVIRQLVVESLILALLGGLVALVVARVGIGILAAALPPNLAVVAPPTIDGRVLAFTLLLATVTSFLFGLWPAIGSARVPLNDAIKLGGYGATRQRGRGARGALVVAEMSLALVLLIGAGLLIRSLDRLLRVDAGIRTENVVTARMTLPDAKYDSRIGKATLVTSIVERLRGVAGVSVAGAVNSLPMESEGGIGFRTTPEDAPNDESRMAPASFLLATPGYFKAVGARLRGQDLPATYDSTRKVVVINEALAKVLWPNANPIGKRVVTPIDGAHTVIGVVGDIRTEKLDEPAGPQCYYPLAEAPQSYLAIVVRGDAPAGVLVSRIRDVVRSVDPMQPVYATRTLEDVVHESVAPRRTNAMLLGSFGFVAVLLAAIGVYAVLAYGVAQRTREIGVRVALGAESRDVVRLVVSQGAVLALVGIAIGLAAAFALSRFLNAILYEVSPHDAGVFVAAPALLLVIALLATWLPARRASRVNPVDALRDV
jgi:predicted permease